jgi:hypothetical protein
MLDAARYDTVVLFHVRDVDDIFWRADISARWVP